MNFEGVEYSPEESARAMRRFIGYARLFLEREGFPTELPEVYSAIKAAIRELRYAEAFALDAMGVDAEGRETL